MLYQTLIPIMERNLNTLTRMWSDEINKSGHMSTYQALSEKELSRRGTAVFTNLVEWLKSGASNDQAEKYFEKVGAERFHEGFPMAEINYALYLVKKVLWIYAVWKEEVTGSMKPHNVIEFTTVLSNYFDLGYFYLARGYFKELMIKIDNSDVIAKEELKDFLIKGSAGSSDLDKSKIVWR